MEQRNRNANSFDHKDAIPLLWGYPGQRLVFNMCTATGAMAMWGYPSAILYYVGVEFNLGIDSIEGKGSRIDALLRIFPPGVEEKTVNFGIEIKCSEDDLMRDTKLAGRYLRTRACDYWWCVTATEQLSLLACKKYRDNPAVGVASLSGIVFKLPQAQRVMDYGRNQVVDELRRRALLPPDARYLQEYRRDAILVNVRTADFQLPMPMGSSFL